MEKPLFRSKKGPKVPKRFTAQEEKQNVISQAHFANFITDYNNKKYPDVSDTVGGKDVQPGSVQHQWMAVQQFIKNTNFDKPPEVEQSLTDEVDIVQMLEDMALEVPAPNPRKTTADPFTKQEQEEEFKAINELVFEHTPSSTTGAKQSVLSNRDARKDNSIRSREFGEIDRRNKRRMQEREKTRTLVEDTFQVKKSKDGSSNNKTASTSQTSTNLSMSDDNTNDESALTNRTNSSMSDGSMSDESELANCTDSSKSDKNTIDKDKPTQHSDSSSNKSCAENNQGELECKSECTTIDSLPSVGFTALEKFQYCRQKELRRFRTVTKTLYNYNHDYEESKSNLHMLTFSENYVIASKGEYMYLAKITSSDPISRPEFRATPVFLPTGLATIRISGTEAIVSVGTGELFTIDLEAGATMYDKRTVLCPATHLDFGKVTKPKDGEASKVHFSSDKTTMAAYIDASLHAYVVLYQKHKLLLVVKKNKHIEVLAQHKNVPLGMDAVEAQKIEYINSLVDGQVCAIDQHIVYVGGTNGCVYHIDISKCKIETMRFPFVVDPKYRNLPDSDKRSQISIQTLHASHGRVVASTAGRVRVWDAVTSTKANNVVYDIEFPNTTGSSLYGNILVLRNMINHIEFIDLLSKSHFGFVRCDVRKYLCRSGTCDHALETVSQSLCMPFVEISRAIQPNIMIFGDRVTYIVPGGEVGFLAEPPLDLGFIENGDRGDGTSIDYELAERVIESIRRESANAKGTTDLGAAFDTKPIDKHTNLLTIKLPQSAVKIIELDSDDKPMVTNGATSRIFVANNEDKPGFEETTEETAEKTPDVATTTAATQDLPAKEKETSESKRSTATSKANKKKNNRKKR